MRSSIEKITSPLAGWVGGKSLLAKTIIERIPEHTCYAEVFAGALWVLFKKQPSKAEVVNDINLDIVNLYRVIQHHPEEFLKQFKWAISSRQIFEWLEVATQPETLTDIQRAARFYFLQQECYAGRMNHKRNFGYSPTRPPKLNLMRIEERISEAHLRLSGVYIERLPYQEIFKRYDREGTFFYADPPYYGCENHYGTGIFDRSDFAQLAGLLGGIKGKFLMSINDTPEIREMFGHFTVEEVPTHYSMQKGVNRRVMELLVRNF